MIKLNDLQGSIYNRFLEIKALHKLLTSPLFIILFKEATDNERELIKFWIDNHDRIKLNNWIKEKNERNLFCFSLRRLREIASNLGIRYYCSLSRLELILQIKHQQELNQKIDQILDFKDIVIGEREVRNYDSSRNSESFTGISV